MSQTAQLAGTLSIDAFAARHGVATRTVRRWLDAGRIPGATMIAGKWALPADAVVQQPQQPAGGREIATVGHGQDMSRQLTVPAVLAQLPVMVPLDVAARVLGISEYALRRHAEYFELQRLGARGAYVMPKSRIRELEG